MMSTGVQIKKALYIVMLFASLLLFQACAGQMSAVDMNLQADFPSQQGPSSSGGDGAVVLEYVKPEAHAILPQVEIQIHATPMDQIRALRLYINDQPVRLFTQTPFTYVLNTRNINSPRIEIRAESEDMQGKHNYATFILGEDAGPTPTTTPGGTNPNPGDSSRNAGTFDPNCMNNSQYDACIFWKNPVAHNGALFSTPVRFGMNLSQAQTFGVNLEDLSNPSRLQNTSIRIWSSAASDVELQNGRFMRPYAEDTASKATVQLMAYFWLNYQINETQRRAGNFYARNRNIPVDAYNPEVRNNAYWDGGQREIVMGAALGSSNQPEHEMTLSAEVLLHEMGHANLQFAVGGYQAIAPSSSTTRCGQGTCFCLTQQGCIGAINEGQADFHYLMLFRESTPLGETWMNSLGGLPTRNVANNANISASQMFQLSSQGQIHRMGSLYASILWTIYNNPSVDKREFERLFILHLQKLTGSSRFTESKEILIADDQVVFSGKYRSVIEQAFAARGL